MPLPVTEDWAEVSIAAEDPTTAGKIMRWGESLASLDINSEIPVRTKGSGWLSLANS